MMSKPDLDALRAVLPPSVDIASPFSYFCSLVEIFEAANHASHVVSFAKRALENAPEDEDTEGLWVKIYAGYTNLEEYENAYMTLVASPHHKMCAYCA